ncbi:MAG: pyridine nucleotide-disulfide oxidoreductase [Acidobacteria bacterium]|nr:pyridine nucleotide-disulfide oxidoreductase [Acidobacteriota bacterium]
MAKMTVVILGGGVGGIIAANRLRERLSERHRVVLVERNSEHAFAPSFLWLMTGDRKFHQIRRPLTTLLRHGVEFLHTNAEELDIAKRKVLFSAGEIAFDYLVVAVGAELVPDAIPGLAEASQTFYTVEGASRLNNALASFSGGTIAIVVASMPYKCPGAPHEGAMLIADYFRRKQRKAGVNISLFTPEPQPMPVAGPQLGTAVVKMLESKHVHFRPLNTLEEVNPSARMLKFKQGGIETYDLLVAIPPHRAPRLVKDAGLTNTTGWVPVNPQTLATAYEGVFALGDVTAIPIPGRWKPDVPLMLPKAGVFAHAQAEVVAARISSEIEGRTADKTFCGDGYCMLEAGENLAGFAYGNFFAEPSPQVNLRQIGKAWHIGKVLFEQWWLSSPGWKRKTYGAILKMGGKFYGIPITV